MRAALGHERGEAVETGGDSAGYLAELIRQYSTTPARAKRAAAMALVDGCSWSVRMVAKAFGTDRRQVQRWLSAARQEFRREFAELHPGEGAAAAGFSPPDREGGR